MEISPELGQKIDNIVNEAGFEIFDKSLRQSRSLKILRVLVDAKSGGINVSQCLRLNKQIIKLLEDEKLLGDEFEVEVSSPGLDWPVRTNKDFERIMGRKVRVYLTQPIGEKFELSGILKAVNEETVEILVNDEKLELKRDILSKVKEEY